jgi:hypothetical protein
MTPFMIQCTYVDEDKWAWGGSTIVQRSRWCEIWIFLHAKFWDSHTDSIETGEKCTQDWEINLPTCIQDKTRL